MSRTAITLAIFLTSALALPAAAQSLAVLLPSISFPDPVPAPSTKGCVDASAKLVCSLKE